MFIRGLSHTGVILNMQYEDEKPRADRDRAANKLHCHVSLLKQ